MPLAQDRHLLNRPTQFHPSVLKAMELARVEPGYMLLSISSMLAMLNNSLENCLLFGGYALAKEIVTSDACLETTRLLHRVFSKITTTGEEEGAVSNLREAAAFQTFCDFLEEAVQLMDGLKDEMKSTEEVIRDLNRFRDDDIPRVLREMFSVIRGEAEAGDVLAANPALRNLSILMQAKHRPELHEKL